MNKKEFSVTISKTALGIQVMKDRSVSLSAQQRSALILCDGKRSADDVVRMTSAVGVTMQDIQALNALGLIHIEAEHIAAPKSSHSAIMSVPGTTSSVSTPIHTGAPVSLTEVKKDIDFSAALNAAITLCSTFSFKGFGLNMALTGVDSLEKLQKLAPEIRRVAGDAKYKPLHEAIFGKSL